MAVVFQVLKQSLVSRQTTEFLDFIRIFNSVVLYGSLRKFLPPGILAVELYDDHITEEGTVVS
jgi:hypothetical protein